MPNMTVEELRRALSRYPAEAQVAVFTYHGVEKLLIFEPRCDYRDRQVLHEPIILGKGEGE